MPENVAEPAHEALSFIGTRC